MLLLWLPIRSRAASWASAAATSCVAAPDVHRLCVCVVSELGLPAALLQLLLLTYGITSYTIKLPSFVSAACAGLQIIGCCINVLCHLQHAAPRSAQPGRWEHTTLLHKPTPVMQLLLVAHARWQTLLVYNDSQHGPQSPASPSSSVQYTDTDHRSNINQPLYHCATVHARKQSQAPCM